MDSWWFLLQVHLVRGRKDDLSFYHILFTHLFSLVECSHINWQTPTCPNAFAWGIIAFWVLVVLVDRNDRTRGTVTKFGQFTEARFKGHRKEMVRRVARLQGPGIPGWFPEGSYLIKQGTIFCFPVCLFLAVISRLLLPVSNCYLIRSPSWNICQQLLRRICLGL